MKNVFRPGIGYIRWWAFACLLGAFQIASAQALEPGQFRSSPSGTLVWEPSTAVGKRLVGQGIWTQATGGIAVAETGAVALRGAQITLTAERAISAAAVARGAATLFGGPFGVALALAPAIIEWVEKDQAANVRINPDRSGFQKKDPNAVLPPVSTGKRYNYGYDYYHLPWHNDPIAACQAGLNYENRNRPDVVSVAYGMNGTTCLIKQTENGRDSYPSVGLDVDNDPSCPAGYYIMPTGCVKNPNGSDWLPASMNDIAPYLYPYAVPLNLAKQVIQAGVDLQGTMKNITGPATVGDSTPKTDSEPVNTPPEQISNRTISGNPYNLPSGTPTVTGNTTGSTPINVGGNTVNAPTRSTTTSTYNPTTNTTSNTTSTTADPLTKNTTTNTTTNVTYNTTNATATTTTSTTTNIVNNVTNQTIYNNTTKTPVLPTPDPAEPAPEFCKENPDVLACAKLGEPGSSDALNKTSKAFQMTPAVFASAASCPPPVTFSLSMAGVAGSYAIPYTAACEVMGLLRALIIACAGFAAAYILADSFKVT